MKAKVEVTYSSTKGLLVVAVNNKELDISSIQDKQIADWFRPSGGRDGWEGLIVEIRKFLADSEAELDFCPVGPEDFIKSFNECLQKNGICIEGGPSEDEIAENNFQAGKKAEHRENEKKHCGVILQPESLDIRKHIFQQQSIYFWVVDEKKIMTKKQISIKQLKFMSIWQNRVMFRLCFGWESVFMRGMVCPRILNRQ